MGNLLHTLIINGNVMICVDFQRPVWFHPHSMGMRLIPHSPETITQDAVLFYGLYNLSLSTPTKNKIREMTNRAARSAAAHDLPDKYLDTQDYLLQLDKYADNFFDEIRAEMANATLSGNVQVINHTNRSFDFGCKVESPCIATCQTDHESKSYIFDDREN